MEGPLHGIPASGTCTVGLPYPRTEGVHYKNRLRALRDPADLGKKTCRFVRDEYIRKRLLNAVQPQVEVGMRDLDHHRRVLLPRLPRFRRRVRHLRLQWFWAFGRLDLPAVPLPASIAYIGPFCVTSDSARWVKEVPPGTPGVPPTQVYLTQTRGEHVHVIRLRGRRALRGCLPR